MAASFHTLLEIFLRTGLIYAAVMIGMRLSGKREIGQMTPLDLVLLLLIANAVQNAMTGPDTTLTGGLTAAATLFFINAMVALITRKSSKVRHFVEGSPTPLIHHGKILEGNLAREKLSKDELYEALREHGISEAGDVELAMLEIDGSISTLRKDEMPTIPRPHHRIRFLKRKS